MMTAPFPAKLCYGSDGPMSYDYNSSCSVKVFEQCRVVLVARHEW